MRMVISGHARLGSRAARFGAPPPRAWDRKPIVGLTGKGSNVLEELSASLSGNLLNQDGTEFNFAEYDEIVASLSALPDTLSVESVEAVDGTLTLASFGEFDGARVVVETNDLAYAAGLECLRQTRRTLADLGVKLNQVRNLVEDTEMIVATSMAQVVTVGNFSLNPAPATEGDR